MPITKEKIWEFIKKRAHEYIKFQMIPAVFCGMLFSILSTLTLHTEFQVGFEFFQIIQNPIFIAIMGVFSFDYIYTLYKEHLESNYHIGWFKKFHKGFALFAGLFAAFNAYFFPQISLLFTTVASEAKFDISSIIIPVGSLEFPVTILLPVATFVFIGMTKEMFISLDGKSGYFFKMTKRTPMPIPNYSSLEYRVDYFFGFNRIKKLRSRK